MSNHAQMQSKNRSKVPYIYLTKHMHGFYCEWFYYGDCKNTKTYQMYGGNARSDDSQI